MPPIDVVVYHGSHARPGFEVGFPLRCFQRLSRPHDSYPAARLAPRPVHQRCVHPGPLVLGTDPLKSRTPTADSEGRVSHPSRYLRLTHPLVPPPYTCHHLPPTTAALPYLCTHHTLPTI